MRKRFATAHRSAKTSYKFIACEHIERNNEMNCIKCNWSLRNKPVGNFMSSDGFSA